MINNSTTWGVDITYFENTFTQNTMGTFKVQASVFRNFNGDISTLFNNIANIFIGGLTRLPQARILNEIRFDDLRDDTKEVLRESVCLAVQHAARNKAVFEKLFAANIQTNSFNITQDTTNWLIANDMIGLFAKNGIANSLIGNYSLVDEEDFTLFIRTNSGNYEAIGYYDFDAMTDLT